MCNAGRTPSRIETELNNLAFEAIQTAQKMSIVLGMWQNEFSDRDSGTKAEILVSLLLDYVNKEIALVCDIEKATSGTHQE